MFFYIGKNVFKLYMMLIGTKIRIFIGFTIALMIMISQILFV